MNDDRFPVVGLGASAGGLEAFRAFFEHMPADCGMAFVMILHLPADRKSMLADILGRWTSMRVIDGGNRHTAGTQLRLRSAAPRTGQPRGRATVRTARRPQDEDRMLRPIDAFFDSLAPRCGNRRSGSCSLVPAAMAPWVSRRSRNAAGSPSPRGPTVRLRMYGEMPAGAIATGAVDHRGAGRGDSRTPAAAIKGFRLRGRGRLRRRSGNRRRPACRSARCSGATGSRLQWLPR